VQGYDRLNCGTFSSDGARVFLGVNRASAIIGSSGLLYEIASGQLVREFSCPTRIWCVALSPDGRYAAMGGAEFQGKVVNRERG